MRDERPVGFVAPYLRLMRQDAPQRERSRRGAFVAVRWFVKTGPHRRYMPGDFPPRPAVYQQARRWPAAGAFETMAHDLRKLLRIVADRDPPP